MGNYKSFSEKWAEHEKTLELYVPVVAKVHGKEHPEFYEVHKLYDAIKAKADGAAPDLGDEFSQLNTVTDGYKIPGDVCESYEAVYNMLAELNEAYKA